MDEKAADKKVLVVDDDAAILGLMKLFLESKGFVPFTAWEAPKVSEMIQEHQFLAVLLDISMPHADGFQILKTIKTAQPDLPVIMVTGHHDEMEAVRAIEMGALDYVTKPVDFNYLLNLLETQGPA